jgi:hypothetical protein
MRYAKWLLVWEGEPQEGYGPEGTALSLGGSAEGAFSEGDPRSFIYGYVSDDLDLTALANYEMTEVTEAEILQKAQEQNPECYIDSDGRLAYPQPERP